MWNCTGRPITVLLCVVGLLLFSGCGESVSAPTSFASYTSTDGRFSCDYPQGWQAEGGGSTDYSWAKFTKGGVEIRIDADIAGSLFGDIAKSSSAMMGGTPDESSENAPVAQVHEQGLKRMKNDYTNYQEREPKVVKADVGVGRRSTFIADQTLGGKLYGYRATFLGNDRRLTVLCTCPATNWQALKPAFEKVVASLRYGGR
jgi:hypothetical protein